MPRKTRKSSTVNKSDPKKSNVNRNKENKEDAHTDSFSLPVLSDEKIYSDDKGQKASKSKEGKVPRIVIPKVRLTCFPLNIEKVIDLTTNKVVKDGSIKKRPGRKKGTNTVEKSSKKTQSFKPNKIKPGRYLRPRFKDEEEYRYLYNSPNLNVGSCQKKIKIYIKESKFILRKDSAVSCKNSHKEENETVNHSLEGKTEYCIQQTDMNTIKESQNAEEHNKLNDLNFDLAPDTGNTVKEGSELKESGSAKTQATGEDGAQNKVTIEPVVQCSEAKSSCSSLVPKLDDQNEPKCRSLQAAMESFMNSTELENQKDIIALKNGLCFVWMTNNYNCNNGLCPYQHNASSLFTKKLKQYSSRHIMAISFAMKNDSLFVDVVLSAFKILSERKMPAIWVTFLIYFVFYVTEPSDSRFFKFWASAARFFYGLSEDYSAAKGFASLLSVFSHGDKSEEWKIVEFIKFIKQSPIQIHTTYDLLQPILNLDLPCQFLLEAVESCIATEKDVLEVYTMIIPKISIMTSPIPVIELLLKFCGTLQSLRQENLAHELKQKLTEKVRTFKIKIFHREYPLTAAFQEQVPSYSIAESDGLFDTPPSIVNSDLLITPRKSNYFQPENDFFNSITRIIELGSDKLPGDFNKVDDKKAESLSKEEESMCDRQVTRVKQFFTDCHFDVLGKYLNSLKLDAVEQTAQEFLKALFQMKITLQQVLDLIKIILLHCQSETAAKINASVCVTLIVNFVRINEWEKALTILSLCDEKEINLIEGKVYYFNDLGNITQFRVVLLLVEIYIYKENFQTAFNIIKTQYLYSTNTSLWKLSWKNNDEAIRARILEEFLGQTILKQLTNIAHELFMMIWIDQKMLHSPVDLGKFTNEMLILLLNQNAGEGLKFYEKIRGKITLEETTTRAILVSLVGQNNLQEAKNVMLAISQTIYTPPEVTPNGATVTMSSVWLEEEIFVMLDSLFDMLINEMNPALRNFEHFEVNIHVVKPKAMFSSIRPLCLGLINSSLEHACKRIERVLQHQFKPPIKLIILPYSLVLDKPSLQVYLERRLRRASG